MKCPHCKSKMERDEDMVITHWRIVNHPEEHKTGWKCPRCDSIVFDEGIRI